MKAASKAAWALGVGIALLAGFPGCSGSSGNNKASAGTDGGAKDAKTRTGAGPSKDATSNPESGSSDGGSRSSSSALPQAEQLLTSPTLALTKEARADHVPTQSEQALVALYWAFLANAYTTGEYDPLFMQAGIEDAVVQLASNYPSFFRPGDGGTFVAYDVNVGQTTFTCSQSCAPSASTLKTTAVDAFSAITGVLGVITATPSTASALSKIFTGAEAIMASRSAGEGLSAAVASLVTGGGAAQTLAGLQSVAGAFISGAVLATAGTEAALAATVVAAAYSATVLAVDLVPLLLALDRCQNFQSMSCCPGGTCNTPPPTSCSGGKLVVPLATGTCASGVCSYPKTVDECPDGATCPDGSSTCVAEVDGGHDAAKDSGNDAGNDAACPAAQKCGSTSCCGPGTSCVATVSPSGHAGAICCPTGEVVVQCMGTATPFCADPDEYECCQGYSTAVPCPVTSTCVDCGDGGVCCG